MLACQSISMQVIPAIDLLGGAAVRLDQGSYDRVLFRHDLDDYFRRMRQTTPSLIHVVDLDGAREGRMDEALVQRCVTLAEGTPVQVSGGLRGVEVARRALELGAARVIIGSAAWASPEALAAFARALGPRLVVALDVREGRIAVRGWTATEALSVDEALTRCARAGVIRLHVTAIERDGTMSGPDLALYERACASGLAVIAAGGVRDDGDLAHLEDVGCEAAVMGVGYLARLGLRLPDTHGDQLVPLGEFGDKPSA